MTNERPPVWLVAGLLGLAAVALYWPATGYDFVNYDDPAYFSENEHVLGGLTWSNLAWAFQATADASWYPVSWLSFMLDATLFGRGPAGPHFMNVLLHAANGVLLFLLWKGLAGSVWRSALVAGLFVLHPVHVESVAWVSERKDVLSTLFGLLALIAYTRYADSRRQKAEGRRPKARNSDPASEGVKRTAVPGSTFDVRCSMLDVQPSPFPSLAAGGWWYWSALLLFALGLMSKPMLVTWPFVMLLLDYWPLGRLQPNTYNSKPKTVIPLLLEKIPFLLLSIIASTVNMLVHKQVGALVSFDSVSLPARIANAFVSYARYFQQTVWPTNFAVPYLHPGHWPLASVCWGVVLVGGLSSVSLFLGRRRRSLSVGWCWFLGTLVPVIGLIQWGNHAMADRFMYVPSVGLLVALVWGLGKALEQRPWPKPAVGFAVALALFALALQSRAQLRYWQSGETLFRHALAVTGDNHLAHNNLGAALARKGQTDEAIRQFQEAIRLRPDGANAYGNLGIALIAKGQFDAAISQLQEAARLKPDSAIVHYNLGVALGRQGQTNAAIRQFQEAICLQPTYPEALGSLAGTLEGRGKYTEAIRFYQTALKTQPDQGSILNNLAWLLATCPDPAARNGPEAVRLARRACEVTGYAKPLFIGTLAAAQAEADDFPAAIATAEQAAALAASLHLEDLAAKNRELLQLYRQGQPFHQTRLTTDGHR
jgi:Flp pilus assembly protein TadD